MFLFKERFINPHFLNPSMAEIIVLPAIFAGLIIGLYEAIIIHRDVTIPTHRFGHMIHALVLSVLFVFVNMNVPFVYSLFPALKGIAVIGTPIFFQIIIGLIAMIKIHGVSKALQSSGMSSAGMAETWFHSLLIGSLIVALPYIYPFVAPSLPSWMK